METVMEFAPKTAGQSRASRRKVKTGCATCRTRKVKCDEGRPACQKCVSTGRTCDGYASPFRAWAGEHQSNPPKGMAQTAPALTVKAPIALTVSDGPSGGTSDDISPDLDTTASEITAADIDALQRCFSTKTLFPTVTLSCDDEARQILQASKTDPAVRHAVSSLRALRADLEAAAQASSERAGAAQSTLLAQATSAYAVAPGTTPSRDYGLQQYCLALGGLASHLSLSSARLGPTPSVRSALLCCQIFISIEQMRGDLAAMAQHIVQGLRILYEHQHPNAAHARPPACKDDDDAHDLPALDVFVIKLFAAPCKFADITFETPSSPGTTPSSASTDGSESGGSASSWRLRPLAPDLSTELIRLALESLSFLEDVRAGAPISSLSSKKEYLLRSLATWHARLQREQLTTAHAELLSILFLRFFHQTVRVVILSVSRDVPDGAGLGYTEGSRSEILDDEFRQLQSIASIVGERVRSDGRQGGDW